MNATETFDRARPWVKLYVSAGRSDRVLDLSTPAKALWPLALIQAAAAQADGVITVAPKSVARWSGMEPAEIADAIAELLEVGLFIDKGSDTVYLWNWDAMQDSEGELAARRESERTRKAKQRDRAKQAAPAGEPAAEEAPAAEPPTELFAMEVPTKSEVIAKLIAACETLDGAPATYAAMHDHAASYAAPGGKYEAVKGIGPKSLSDVVAVHAASQLAGIDSSNAGECRRVASLSKQYGTAIYAALATAGAGAKGDPLAYATSILKGGAK